MIKYHKIFIENLKKLRKEQNITQAQLAELCDVSNGPIGNIESGITKPSFDLFLTIAEKLHVSPIKLFYNQNDTEQEQKELLQKLETNIISFIESEFRNI